MVEDMCDDYADWERVGVVEDAGACDDDQGKD